MSTSPTGSLAVLTTKGDLILLDGADLVRLAVGTNGKVLVAKSTTASGVEWALALSTGFLTGARMSPDAVTPDEQTDIAPGSCRDADDTFDMVWTGTLTGDVTVVGPDGRDAAAAVTANTHYFVYVIVDSTGANPPAALYSLSATAPTLPGGYDKKRRMGAVLTDSAIDFWSFVQTGNGTTRRIWYDTAIGASGMRVITNGSAAAWTDVGLSAFVPSTSEVVLLSSQFETGAGGAASDDAKIRPDGFSFAAGNGPIGVQAGVVSSAKLNTQTSCACPGQIIEYMVDDAANNQVTLAVFAYDDEL